MFKCPLRAGLQFRNVIFPLQLKEQMLLLEAQLEKQSDNQGMSEELEQVCWLDSPAPNHSGAFFCRGLALMFLFVH